MSDEQLLLPIIDSHIHLPDGTVGEYEAATATAPSLLGYVLVEAGRDNDLEAGARDGSGWKQALDELRSFRQVAEGDGRGACLGIVAWAPLPSGPEVLSRYLTLAEEAAGPAWAKVRGVRYSVREAPAGAMLTEDFIGSLRLLGARGLAVDVAVDQRARGKRQLDEVVEMIGRAHDGVPAAAGTRTTFILDHLCGPDLSIYNITSDPSFHAWRTAMYTLSKAPCTYVKLSGCLARMPASLRAQPVSHLFQSTLGWLGIVLATFGPERIMFGSDWPACDAGDAADAAWPKWRELVDKMCWMASLADEERAMIFAGTAKKAYCL